MLYKFLEEFILTTKGYDVDEIKKEKYLEEKAKKEIYKENNFIPRQLKKYGIGISILLLVFNILTLITSIVVKYKFGIIKYSITIVASISAIVLMTIQKKQTQYVGAGLFIIQFIMTLFII